MALAGSLLIALVMSTALAGMLLVGAIERRAAESYRTRVELRAAASGAAALAAAELAQIADWGPALSGSGSALWREPSPAIDLAAETARIRAVTVLEGAHGADTPVWQVFAQTPWAAVSGLPASPHVIVWVADDWEEQDGQPLADSNGLILVRAAAFQGVASGWIEMVYGRGGAGRLDRRQARSW